MVIIMTMMMMMVIIMINDDDYNWIWFSRVETICSSWERTRSKAIFSLTKDWLRAHLQIVITWPCLHPYKMAFLAPIGPEALIAPFLDFQSVNWCNRHYKSHSKSFKQYQCNWCHKTECRKFKCSNDSMFQCSNVPMFQCFNVQMFKCLDLKIIKWIPTPAVCQFLKDPYTKWMSSGAYFGQIWSIFLNFSPTFSLFGQNCLLLLVLVSLILSQQ